MTTAMPTDSGPIGAVFTPLDHALQTIERFNLYNKWRDGAVLLDPTAGSGNLIEAFLNTAQRQGDSIPHSLLKNLYAVEMQQVFIESFHKKIKEKYGIRFPAENFIKGDYLFSRIPLQADFLIGNPPWLNFCDLDREYKETIKPLFHKSNLAGNKKDLLLGNSRIDIAALILVESVRKNLKNKGQAFFYLPLSLFLNDGAHSHLRKRLTDGFLSLDHIDDFRDFPLFQNVSTRYGFASFTKGEITQYPIPYNIIGKDGKSLNYRATPLVDEGSPLFIHKKNEIWQIPQISINKESKPRQGLNTCGANKLFIFDSLDKVNERLCLLKNKNQEALLPRELVYPLIGADQFKESAEHRYVFLPYRRDGRVLKSEELQKYPEAYGYLKSHKETLENRKGVLIGSSIKKGIWWSLLGIGPYSFSSWKIVWEAYGKKEFRPEIFSDIDGNPWQPNQALQAFLSFKTKKEADKILKLLKNPMIESILKSQGMEGTCNWAQPGRMMKFFTIRTEK